MDPVPTRRPFATTDPATSHWIGEATRRHAVTLALFTAGIVLVNLVGAKIDWRTYAVMGAWMLTNFFMGPWAARPLDLAARLRRYVWTVVADIGFLAVVYLFLDAAPWLGAVFFVHTAVIAAATLPRPWAYGVAALIVVVYAGLVLFAVAGPSFVASPIGLSTVHGNWAFAAATITAAAGIIGLLIFLQTRLVQTIRGAERRYMLLVQAAPDMVMTFDVDGQFVDVNPATEAQSGYTWEEIKTLPNAAFFPPEDWPRVLEARERNFRGETVSMDLRYIRKNGEMRWIQTTSAPYAMPDDRSAVLVIARDVTDSRMQADALRSHEERVRLVIASLDLGFYTIDRNQVVTSIFGRWAERQAGRAGASPMVGRRVRDVAPARWADAHEAAHARALAGEHAVVEWNAEATPKRAERFFRSHLAPLRDEGDLIVGVAGVWSDVSAEVIAAREGAALRDRVAAAERTESLGKLVSGVAHELNNPLAAILTFTEDLLEDRRPDDERLVLEVIQAQALRSRSIVRDLLTYVRGGQRRTREVQPPGPLIEAMLRAMRTGLASEGVRFEAKILDASTPLFLDRAGFEQVVTNLVTNAAQSAGLAGRVSLTAQRRDDHYEVIVDDNGTGVAAEHLSHIFEPFFTTRPTGQGVGLGLSVSLGIARAHGGSLRVENLAEGGARFTFSLPVATGRPPAVTPRRVLSPASAQQAIEALTPKRAEGPPSILIIDDEDTIRSALRRYFERRGWAVDEAPEGGEALRKLLDPGAPARFDIVLCDLKMPQVSGIEVFTALQRDAPVMARRVIFATGDASAEDVTSFLATVTVPVIEKPFDLADLEYLAARVASLATGRLTETGRGPQP